MTHKREVAYISGAISSDPNYRGKFADAETVLMNLGFDVLNPTCVPALLSYEQHMQIDLIFSVQRDGLTYSYAEVTAHEDSNP